MRCSPNRVKRIRGRLVPVPGKAQSRSGPRNFCEGGRWCAEFVVASAVVELTKGLRPNTTFTSRALRRDPHLGSTGGSRCLLLIPSGCIVHSCRRPTSQKGADAAIVPCTTSER